jgi:hypothetical protein
MTDTKKPAPKPAAPPVKPSNVVTGGGGKPAAPPVNPSNTITRGRSGGGTLKR